MGLRYRPPSLVDALKPYHYPIDQDGNPVPTPGLRIQRQSGSAGSVAPAHSLAVPMPDALNELERLTRT